MKDLRFFINLFKPYALWLIAGFFLALLTALASISLLTLSAWFITSSAIAGMLAPDGVAITFNFLLPAAEIRALAIVRTLGRYTERVVTHEATFRVLAEIRCWFFQQLTPLVPGRLAERRSADLLNGITQDIDTLESLYLRLCSPFLMAILGGASVCFFIACYSISMALVVLLMLLVIIVLMPWWFHLQSKQFLKTMVEASATLKVQSLEILQGMAELIVFEAYQYYKKQLIKSSETLIETQRDSHRVLARSSAITLFVAHSTMLIIIIMSADLFQQGHISGAVLVMLSFAVLAVFELLMPLASSTQILAKTQTAAQRIRAITELPPGIIEPQQPYILSQQTVDASATIKLNNVSFRYCEQTNWVLKDINLQISARSKIAIIGRSGAGKSTLLQLIMRYYDPQQGSIDYASIPYLQLNSDHLMQQFSVMTQHTQLFACSIKQNLLMAKPSATTAELIQAIKLAKLENYIRQLPDGMETWVGEQGIKVSGGEARRIALARVYLKNAPILILDEPTESLDMETAADVLNALQQIAKEKTVIMVTHKTIGLDWFDKVYTVKEGMVGLTK